MRRIFSEHGGVILMVSQLYVIESSRPLSNREMWCRKLRRCVTACIPIDRYSVSKKIDDFLLIVKRDL